MCVFHSKIDLTKYPMALNFWILFINFSSLLPNCKCLHHLLHLDHNVKCVYRRYPYNAVSKVEKNIIDHAFFDDENTTDGNSLHIKNVFRRVSIQSDVETYRVDPSYIPPEHVNLNVPANFDIKSLFEKFHGDNHVFSGFK
jgi:hypothetical protein